MKDSEEKELWRKFRKTGNLKFRNYFADLYSPLTQYIAGKVAGKLPQNVDVDDLVSYGYFGLLDAIYKFDPESNIEFKAFAETHIRSAIFDELRNIDQIEQKINLITRDD